MALIVVSGALANKPGNGGDAWTRLSWILGLKRLGHDVYFIEQIAPAACVDDAGAPCEFERSANRAYFQRVMRDFGLTACSAFVTGHAGPGAGLEWPALLQIVEAADLLVNISGHLVLDDLKSRCRRRAFIDLDPGFTQIWHAEGRADDQLRDHHFYFTVGANVGTPGCTIPTGGIHWRPVRQPVVLEDWPVTTSPDPTRFTTVSSWRGPFGRVTLNGVTFGLKAHEFRKCVTLPARTRGHFEIALDVHPADRADLDLLRSHAWTIVDPRVAVPDPQSFRAYVQRSGAEFSVAQGVYVETRSGWVSDRTVRYLASGKPALVQDTGVQHLYPVGIGLVPFRTLEEAARGADAIMADYETHARAARAIAEQWFDSDAVLSGFLRDAGIAIP